MVDRGCVGFCSQQGGVCCEEADAPGDAHHEYTNEENGESQASESTAQLVTRRMRRILTPAATEPIRDLDDDGEDEETNLMSLLNVTGIFGSKASDGAQEAGGQDDAVGGHNVLALTSLYKMARNIRNTVAKRLAPTVLEMERGVKIEHIYEFYDPSTRKVRTVKMTSKAVHMRRSIMHTDLGMFRALNDPTAEAVPCAGDETSESASSGSSSPSMKGAPGTPKSRESLDPVRRSSRRLMSMSNPEARDKYILSRDRDRVKTVNVLTSVRERAQRVKNVAAGLARKIGQSSTLDILDHEWRDELLLTLFGTEYLDSLMLLANAARKLVVIQPVLAEVDAPAKVFGDIHGQLRDVLMLFHAFGLPSETSPSFVFNGDFVDRGAHQLEVVGLLFALKVLYPTKVWLLRGNHEDRGMNAKYGFKDTCTAQLGQDFGLKIYDLIHKCFDHLPVCAVIEDKVLVVHGGIGDGMWKLSDLRAVKRPLDDQQLEQPSKSWIYNLLWSDPIEDGQDADEVFGVHVSPRGKLASVFAWNVTKMFCARNGLSLVIRSHQSKQDSLGFDVMHENLLIRVFSARDYEEHCNDGAVLLISKAKDEEGLLMVRPQVVRSVMKQRKEALLKKGKERRKSVSGNPTEDARAARTSRISVRPPSSEDLHMQRERRKSHAGVSAEQKERRKSHASISPELKERRKSQAGLAAAPKERGTSGSSSSEADEESASSGLELPPAKRETSSTSSLEVPAAKRETSSSGLEVPAAKRETSSSSLDVPAAKRETSASSADSGGKRARPKPVSGKARSPAIGSPARTGKERQTTV
eukprot:TRINITY_DN15490_c0_g1_i1.p1 TRINITY_DN15490_c0_g1~~TRINITY_DN15490_c0_g1_i1.p1  ORF type:complete len:839 (-),score=142.09 TRINITY_DN15490_c0_g1_i1:52-2481(-)